MPLKSSPIFCILLEFSSVGAALYMELPSDPQEQEFPPGFTGAIPTEASMEIIFKNQISFKKIIFYLFITIILLRKKYLNLDLC